MDRTPRVASRILFSLVVAALLGLLSASASAEGSAPLPAERPDEAGQASAEHEGVHQGEHHILDNWFSLSFGPGKEHKNGPFGFAVLNFAVLVWLGVRFGGKPIKEYLQQRHISVRRDLEEAAALNRQARAAFEEIEAKLAAVDREVAAIKEAVAQDAQQEKARIIKAAEAEAERIITQADDTLAREIRRARRYLEGEAVDAAMKAAERLIRQQLSEGDRQRLDEEYLSQIGSGGGVH